MKKKIAIILAILFTICVLFFVFIVCSTGVIEETMWRCRGNWMVGKNQEQIEERYGEMKQSSSHSASYTFQTSTFGMRDWNTLEVYFDENGKCTKTELILCDSR